MLDKMIVVKDKTLCCGCNACAEICPVQCIRMQQDSEGFDYPLSDASVCIGCGQCESVCPLMNKKSAPEPLATFASRSLRLMSGSSSGGIFPLLAENVVNQGGVVYGAAFDDSMSLRHIPVDDCGTLAQLFGSKYVQSDMNGVYAQVQAFLDSRREVLFAGTPCQVAGLKGYLGREYENLLTVDLACHGVPSPVLWKLYCDALSQREKSDIQSVNFRDKTAGWRHYRLAYKMSDKVMKIKATEDPYMLLFLQNVSIRPSCYNCTFRSADGCSDLTLGDLWNVRNSAPSLDDDEGVSLVVVRTAKGKQAFEAAGVSDESLCRVEVDYREATAFNGGFSSVIDVPDRRADFFSGLNETDDILKYMKKHVIVKSYAEKVFDRLHSSLSRLKRRFVK